MKLTDCIYSYPWQNPSANNCNSYLIRSDIFTLIDPGHRRFVEKLLLSMRTDGIHEDRIQLIITTHAHPDHFEGIQSFLSKPLLMAMSHKEEVYMNEFGDSFYRMMGMEVPTFRCDFYLKEGELRLGKDTFQIHEVPGHSPGSICIYWPREKALFSGDVIFHLSIGRTDFPGGDGNQLLNGIEALSRLDIEILLPGHGNVIVGKEKVKKNFQYILETFSGHI